jgi:enterochelin esterase-like enzyme
MCANKKTQGGRCRLRFRNWSAADVAIQPTVIRLFLILASFLAIGTAVGAQQQQRPTFVSPEVLPDGRVIVRLWAPMATEVLLSGDWMGPQPPVPLVKDENGVWTATAGPLQPNLYSYAFIVNGVRADDPVCRCSFTAAERFASSRFMIPATAPPWMDRSAPKGTLHYEVFSSPAGMGRRVVVYTPPGYDRDTSRQYPVLILMSGSPGTETDWTAGGGFAEIVFDNLIASRAMEPMLVVMHASDVLRNGRRADNLKEIEPIITTILVPEIRARYRVQQNPASWALAGLSLGGEYALTVGLRHPELFRTVASISGSLVPPDFENRFGAAFADAPRIRRDYRLIWIGSGTEDTFFGGAKALRSRLEAASIPHQSFDLPGPHVMPVFRKQLIELMPKLFR